MFDILDGRRAPKRKSLMNFLSISSDEKVTSVLAVRKPDWEGDWSLIMVTKNGIAKKSDASSKKTNMNNICHMVAIINNYRPRITSEVNL